MATMKPFMMWALAALAVLAIVLTFSAPAAAGRELLQTKNEPETGDEKWGKSPYYDGHDGHRDGHHDGHRDGHYDGHHDGHRDGHHDGHRDGHYDGHHDGHRDGWSSHHDGKKPPHHDGKKPPYIGKRPFPSPPY